MLREDAQQAGGVASTRGDSFWRCAACAAEVARDADRVPLDGVATRAFVNPEGFEFVIAGFTRATGCLDASEPSAYWSWFPGCSWRVCLCRACGAHLGWRFSGRADFYGLSLDRLTAP
jgi:hypothetical protein